MVIRLAPSCVITFGVASRDRKGPHFWRYSTLEFADIRVRSNAVLHTTVRGPPDAEDPFAAIRTREKPGLNAPDLDSRHIRTIVRNIAREQAAAHTENYRFLSGHFPTYFCLERLIGFKHSTFVCRTSEVVSARHLASTPINIFGEGLESFTLTRLDNTFFEAALEEQKGNTSAFLNPRILERIEQGIPFSPGPQLQPSKIYELGGSIQIEQQRRVRKRRRANSESGNIEPASAIEPPEQRPRIEQRATVAPEPGEVVDLTV